MTPADLHELDNCLSSLNSNQIQSLPINKTAEKLSDAYAVLDYIHPFYEGNSRTLRVFLAVVCKNLGIKLNWSRINREELYLARDLAVNKQALPRVFDPDLRDHIKYFYIRSKQIQINQKSLKDLFLSSMSLSSESKLHNTEQTTYKSYQHR